MKVLQICCNLAGSTVFPQLFSALREAGLAQEVFVPARAAQNVNKTCPPAGPPH